MILTLAKQLMSPQKMFTILILGSPVSKPLISCHYYWIGWRLCCNNIQKHREQTTCKTTYMMRIKESERRLFFFFLICRWNIVLHDSYQADEIAIEIEEWKQKISGVCDKSFSRVLLSVSEISIVSQRNCTIWILFDYS